MAAATEDAILAHRHTHINIYNVLSPHRTATNISFYLNLGKVAKKDGCRKEMFIFLFRLARNSKLFCIFALD